MARYLNPNHFQYQLIGKLKKTLQLSAPQTTIFCDDKCAVGKISVWDENPYKIFLTESCWVLCTANEICESLFTYHMSEYFSFD